MDSFLRLMRTNKREKLHMNLPHNINIWHQVLLEDSVGTDVPKDVIKYTRIVSKRIKRLEMLCRVMWTIS